MTKIFLTHEDDANNPAYAEAFFKAFGSYSGEFHHDKNKKRLEYYSDEDTSDEHDIDLFFELTEVIVKELKKMKENEYRLYAYFESPLSDDYCVSFHSKNNQCTHLRIETDDVIATDISEGDFCLSVNDTERFHFLCFQDYDNESGSDKVHVMDFRSNVDFYTGSNDLKSHHFTCSHDTALTVPPIVSRMNDILELDGINCDSFIFKSIELEYFHSKENSTV